MNLDAPVPSTDRAYLLGEGICETMRTVGDTVVGLELHRARWMRGLEWLGLRDEGRFDETVERLLADGSGDRTMRLTASAGDATDFTSGSGLRVRATIEALRRSLSAKVSVATTAVVVPKQPWSGIKTTSFFGYAAARRMAAMAGADDALLVDGAGRAVEASTANLWLVVDGALHAPGPADGAVDGVTRQLILRQTGWKPRGAIANDNVEEAWITNTRNGVVPVHSLDGRPLAAGTWTRQAAEAYAACL